jgi:Ca2+-binding RTX toxin-like protein
MSAAQRHSWDESEHDDDWHHHDEHEDESGDDFDFGDDFHIPTDFRFNLDDLNLKKFGKITDWDASHKGVSVTLGNSWTFSVEGSDLDVLLKGNGHLPQVTGGTVDKFEIDGPGGADFSVSGLNMSAKAFYNALTHFDAARLVNLVIGGDETFSGSSFGDFIFAGDGNDTILGNKGGDCLVGGNGDDLVVGGRGNDHLEGSEGADTFAFAPNSGLDVVSDFNASTDTIDLSAYGFGGCFWSFIDQHTRSEDDDGRCYDEGDVIIDLGGGNAVKLEGVSRWELNPDNVVL